jgi:lysophospholipase L1-like esterase
MTKTPSLKYTLLALVVFTLGDIVYHRVTADELNLPTGLFLLAAVSVVVSLMSESAMDIVGPSSDSRSRIRLLVITISLLLFGVELFLRYGLKRYASYMELNGQSHYTSIYPKGDETWFHTYGDREEITDPRREFTHFRTINSLGLAEREVRPEKDPDEYRMIALGDSFTEGVGTSYEFTWAKVAERKLAARVPGKTITTINAGISGSDLYFQYVLFRERLLSFSPDLVILVMNSSDIEEPMIRGGMERFRPDGTTVYSRQGPSWEWLYGVSFIVRHIVHDVLNYNRYLMKEDETKSEQIKAAGGIAAVIDDFEELSKIHEFDLLFVAQPDAEEVASNAYLYGFGNVVSALETRRNTNFIDLLAYYRTRRIITEKNVREFYWRIDGHHNQKGYEVMGTAIANKVWSLWNAGEAE